MTPTPTAPPIDPTQARITATWKLSGALYALAAHWPSGRLFSGGADRAIHVLDSNAPPPVEVPDKEKKSENEQGKQAAENSANQEKTSKPAELARLEGHENYLSSLAIHGDEQPRLVSASYDRTLAWWDPLAGKLLRRQEAHDGWVREVVFLHGGELLASAGDDMLVKLWDAASGKHVRTLAGHAQQTPEGYATALYCVAPSPDGRFLASGDRHGQVRVWEVESGQLAVAFECPALYTFDSVKRSRSFGGIRTLAFDAGGTRLAVGGIGPVTNVDGFVGPARIEIWDWQAATCVAVAQADKHKAVVNHAEFHPGGEWLLGVGGGDGGGLMGAARLPSEAARPEADPGSSERQGQANAAAAEKKDGQEAAGKEVPAKETPAKIPLVNARSKTHLTRFCIYPDGTRLYTAGFERVDAWDLRSDDEGKSDKAETKG